MNRRPTLESVDLQLMAAIQRDWQAEMRQEARQAHLLGKPSSGENRRSPVLPRKLVIAALAATPIFGWLAHIALAAP